MAHLQYNGVDLQIERTAECSIEPVMDASSGLDMLYQKVRLSVVCVWSPVATTSNPTPQGGDRVGVSLRNLRQLLMTPQQLLVWSIGPDRVFQVPSTFTLQGVGDFQGASDPAGGPFPRSCRVLSISGDKTAIVNYTIEFHVTDCSKVVLSNRWSVSSHIGEQYLTTRVTEGRATLRLDMLELIGTVADAFRANFTLYVPAGFIRKSVHVTATEDGRELVYRVEDRQANLNLGASSVAVKIEGNATGGLEFPWHSVGDLYKQFGSAVRGSIDAGNRSLVGDWTGIAASMAAAAYRMMPHPKANCIVRAYGRAGAGLAQLGQLVANVAIDRFSPWYTLGTIIPVSAYITQVFDSDSEGPVVEGRFEFIPLNTNALAAIFGGGTGALMNMSSDIIGIASPNPAFGNPDFPTGSSLAAPASNASRGTWVGFLVTQALMQGCSTNAVPSADSALPAPPGTAQPVAGGPYDSLA